MAEKIIAIKIDVDDQSIDDVKKSLGELNGEIVKIEDTASGMTLDQKFEAADGAIKAFAGAVEAAVGAVGLLGIESEVFDEYERYALATISFSRGIFDLSEGIDKMRKSTLLANAATKIQNTLNKTTAVTMKALGIATNTTSTAFKGLRAAIAATGIGALVVGIGFLVEKLMTLSSTSKLVEDAQDKLKTAFAETDKEISNTATTIDRQLAVTLERLKSGNLDRVQELELTLKAVKDKEKVYVEERAEIYSQIDEQNKIIFQVNKSFSKKQIEVAKATKDELLKREEEFTDKIGELTQQRTILGIQIVNETLAKGKEAAASLQDFIDKYYNETADTLEEQEATELFFLKRRYENLLTEFDKYSAEEKKIFEEAGLSRQQILDAQKTDEQEIIDKYADIRETNRKAQIQQELANELSFQQALQQIQNDTKLAEIAAFEEDLLREADRFNGRMAVLQEQYLLEAEMLEQAKQNELLILKAAYELGELDYEQYEQLKTGVTEREQQQRLELDKRYNNLRLEEAARAVEEEQGLAMMRVDVAKDAGLAIVGFLTEAFGESKALAAAGIIIEKVAAISEIISNTAVANAKLVAAFPVTLGQPWVGINTAAAAASVASTVLSAQKALSQIGETDSTGGATVSLPSPSAPQTPQQQQGPVPQTFNVEPTVRAYILQGDVTSNNEAAEKLSLRRTLN